MPGKYLMRAGQQDMACPGMSCNPCPGVTHDLVSLWGSLARQIGA